METKDNSTEAVSDVGSPQTAVHLHRQLGSANPPKPVTNDVVAFCAHLKEQDRVTWFRCTDTTFKQNDKVGRVDWMILCPDCEKHVDTTGMMPTIAGIGTFTAGENKAAESTPAP